MQLLKDFWDDIKYYIEEEIQNIKSFGYWKAFQSRMDKIYYLYIGRYLKKIIRIFQWIPVLWEDADYDNSYILSILKYKLIRTQKALREGVSTIEHTEKRVREIQVAIDLIEKIQEDNFCPTEWAMHRMKYGERVHEFEKADTNGRSRGINIYYEKTFGLEEANRVARDEAFNIYRMENEKRQATYNELFSHIATHIQGWWD